MNRKKECCDLKSCFLCKGCLPDWLPLIESHKKNISFKKGALIFEEGAAATGIYFLYSGKVKVHRQWGADKQLILHFAQAGDMIGYRGLGSEKYYPVTATALEPVTLCYVDVSFFETSLQVNHQLTYALMQFYANELQDAERRMSNLAHMDVKGRVAVTLLMLKRKFGQDSDGNINIALTRQDMASYAGTTYETFFRTMNELAGDEVIAVSGKKVKVIMEEKLTAITMHK